MCSVNKNHYFGEIKNGVMNLNKFGHIVNEQWSWMEKQYDYVILDIHVVMPNHFHGIISIDNPEGIGRESSSEIKIKSLSSLMGAFKTTSSKLIHLNGLNEFKWQKSFYDRIIRNEKEFYNLQGYIFENPITTQPVHQLLRRY
jgi:REP element-mobilizing transposase RayT